MARRELALAFLVSGEGTTLDDFAELAESTRIPARIVLVVADRARTPAVERARRRGLRTLELPFRGAEPDRWAAAVGRELESGGTELVVLAGFLTVLPPAFVHRWRGRIVNVHPSLLPRFGGPGLYGDRVHRAVLESGDRETGATVHVVTDDVDRGPILGQRTIDVRLGDSPESLRARLHPHEVELLGETVRRFVDGRIPLPYPA